MSAFARKQLEKWGWKEGEGLGKNKDGMSNYIKTSKHNRATHNRDERGNTYAGIGHESTRGAGAGFSERNQQLESVFAELTQQRKASKKKNRDQDSSSSDEGEVDAEKELKEAEEKRKKAKEEKMKKAQRRLRQEEATNDDDDEEETKTRKPKNSAERARSRSKSVSKSPVLRASSVEQKKKKQQQKRSKSSSSSSSDSSSDSDSDAGGDLTKMSDAELFARCGGVRLGRAGRHRLFDNKLKRIQEFENSAKDKVDPYEEARKTKKKI